MSITDQARKGLNMMNPVSEKFGLGDLLQDGASVVEGNKYYVDGNVLFTGDGLSWDTAFKTFAEASAVSHANIALSIQRGWAWRNTIYVKGDDLTENLVTLPQKTDIVGVGSSDPYSKPCIRGNHVPVNNAMGCHFYNVRFRPAANSDLFVLASTSGGGIEFHNCLFSANYAAFVAPSAIDITASQYIKIENCEFLGAFSGDVIDIGAGRTDSLLIKNNLIRGGADNGIVFTDTATTALGRNLIIEKNTIQVADKTIDDNSLAIVFCIDNRCISAENLGAGSHVIGAATSCGNIVTGANNTLDVPIKAV